MISEAAKGGGTRERRGTREQRGTRERRGDGRARFVLLTVIGTRLYSTNVYRRALVSWKLD
jgi:hypothetical protein